MRKNQDLTVYLLLFRFKGVDHVEMTLERQVGGSVYHYRIDRWTEPKTRTHSVSEVGDGRYIKEAHEVLSFGIKGNLRDIMRAWDERYETLDPKQSCKGTMEDNCADNTRWFIETFTDLDLSRKGTSCDRVWCCLWLPSFLQTCSIPGRIFEQAKTAVAEYKAEPVEDKSIDADVAVVAMSAAAGAGKAEGEATSVDAIAVDAYGEGEPLIRTPRQRALV